MNRSRSFPSDYEEKDLADSRSTISLKPAIPTRFGSWKSRWPKTVRRSGRSEADARCVSRGAERVFAVKEPEQQIECAYWRGRLTAVLDAPPLRFIWRTLARIRARFNSTSATKTFNT